MIEGGYRGGAERDGGAEIGTEERECTQRWEKYSRGTWKDKDRLLLLT